jgi:hypothetical protein
MMSDRVTPSFTLGEFVVSDTATRLGIDNTPPAMVEATLRNVLIPAMQTVRDLLGLPVVIKSGYRCTALNAAVRGAPSSQHVDGHAADFICPAFGTPLEICRFLLSHIDQVKFDQLIQEGGWVHASFSPRPRSEVLTAHFTLAGVSYTPGLA